MTPLIFLKGILNELAVSKVDISGLVDDYKLKGRNYIEINRKGNVYHVFFDPQKTGNPSKSYINLRKVGGKIRNPSIIQLTIDESNFHVENKRFYLISNRSITIGRKQSGLKELYHKEMNKKGFNSSRIITEGSVANLNLKKNIKDILQWMIWAMEVKFKLESIYRFNETTQNEDLEQEYSDGGKELFEHLEFERTIRNSKIVRLKKEKAYAKGKGFIKCECCDFDFRKIYGSIGDGFIECHHLIFLSNGERNTELSDLALVCSNCHRMLHRKNENGDFPTITSLKINLK